MAQVRGDSCRYRPSLQNCRSEISDLHHMTILDVRTRGAQRSSKRIAFFQSFRGARETRESGMTTTNDSTLCPSQRSRFARNLCRRALKVEHRPREDA